MNFVGKLEMARGYPADWDSRRKAVYQRDNFTCQNCGRRGGPHGNHELHAHHVVPKSKGGTHRKSNLKTLCKQCHNSIHGNRSAPTGRRYSEVSESNRNELNIGRAVNEYIEKRVDQLFINYPIVGAIFGCVALSVILYALVILFAGADILLLISIITLTLLGYTAILYREGIKSREDLQNFFEETFN
jgi:hypothetical protein